MSLTLLLNFFQGVPHPSRGKPQVLQHFTEPYVNWMPVGGAPRPFPTILFILSPCQLHCLLVIPQVLPGHFCFRTFVLALPGIDIGVSNFLSSFQSLLKGPFFMRPSPTSLFTGATPFVHTTLQPPSFMSSF